MQATRPPSSHTSCFGPLVRGWWNIRACCRWANAATRSEFGRHAAVTPEFKFIACSRALILAFLFLLGFIGLTRHVYKLQVVNHEHFSNAALESTRKTITAVGRRGNIYDYEGTILGGNLAGQRVCAEPKRLKPEELVPVAQVLAQTLGLDEQELLQDFQRVRNRKIRVALDCTLTRDNAMVISNWNLRPLHVVAPDLPHERWQLFVLPHECSKLELDHILEQLSPIVNVQAKHLRKRIDKALNRPVEIPICNNVDFNTAEKLRKNLRLLEQQLARNAHVKKRKLFIRISPRDTRCYPQGELLANVIGYLNEKGQGVSGIEKLFNKEMTPVNGKLSFRKDSAGRRLNAESIMAQPPRDGADVFLTIRAPIQKIAEEELDKTVEAYNPERAYAVMMNPRTGAIMALAQYPTFNPNNRSNVPFVNMQNHCLNEVFEPGSVMKTLPVAYALDRRVVTLGTQFFCENGYWPVFGKILRDTHRNTLLTVEDIIRVSSNIGTAKVAMEMTAPMLYKAFKDFGLGAKTQLGFIPEGAPHKYFSPEQTGILRALERWPKIAITRYPIGQGVSCTPIQLVQAYGAIANNGVMMRPYIIDRIAYKDRTIRSMPTVKGHPISPQGARSITTALVSVVNAKGGTGKRAALKTHLVAGKTGTGQIFTQGHYAEKYFNASFIGFVPAYSPEFVLLVSVRGVKVHGGTASGPVFRNIAKRTLDFLQVEPDPLSVEQLQSTTQNLARP